LKEIKNGRRKEVRKGRGMKTGKNNAKERELKK
jgi:hypothetical protein